MANDEFPFPFPYVVPVDPNLGRRVDAYFILRVLLGRGGMGSAYLAENEVLAHIKCVVKLVHAEIARSPMALSRYKTEAEALSLLNNHDNIVKLHGIGVLEDGQLFLRFEFVDGTTLARYLTDHDGRLPLRKAAYFIFQMCAALQYAHDRGVIHRDLKPDNVMIENPAGGHLKERIKILDFGIAKVINSLGDATASGMMMGTATFCAPEQMANAAGATATADVFSLAQILYFMLTGTLPWGIPDSDVVIYHKQRTEPPACPPADLVPPAVTKVIHRALALVPEDRPTMHERSYANEARTGHSNDAGTGRHQVASARAADGSCGPVRRRLDRRKVLEHDADRGPCPPCRKAPRSPGQRTRGARRDHRRDDRRCEDGPGRKELVRYD